VEELEDESAADDSDQDIDTAGDSNPTRARADQMDQLRAELYY
jgi:hypothetical protein